jgi:lysophospholipase L1-like esterase
MMTFRRFARIVPILLLAAALLAACDRTDTRRAVSPPATTISAPPANGASRDDGAAGVWEAEIAAIEARQAARPAPANAILFVGSSSIRLWDTLERDFAPAPVINAGFGGSGLADAVRYADRIILPYRPRAVVIYSGENDLAAGGTPERALADFKALISAIHADLPGTPIVYISMKPSPARWEMADRFREANALIRGHIATDPLLSYVDVWPALLGPDGLPRPEMYVADRLHLSAEGSAAWTTAIRDHLAGRVRLRLPRG